MDIKLSKFTKKVQYLMGIGHLGGCGNFGLGDEEPYVWANQPLTDEIAKSHPKNYLDVIAFASEAIKKPLYVEKKETCLLFIGERYSEERNAFEKIIIRAVPIFKENRIVATDIVLGNDCEIAFIVKGEHLTNALTHSLLK